MILRSSHKLQILFWFSFGQQGVSGVFILHEKALKSVQCCTLCEGWESKGNYERIQWLIWIIFLCHIAVICCLSSMTLTKTLLLLSIAANSSHSNYYEGVQKWSCIHWLENGRWMEISSLLPGAVEVQGFLPEV